MKRVNMAAGQRRITLRGLLIFLFTLLALVWVLQWSEATRKVDRLLHDIWVRSNQRTVPSDVVIAAIDTRSLTGLGRWPWSRELQAQLLEQLKKLEVRAVIIDILYVEPSRERADDERLAQAIGNLPITILPVLAEGGGATIASETLPIPSIVRHVTDLGHVFLPIDDDGIVRRVFLKAGFGRAHWPSLSLAALNALEGMPEEIPGRFIRQPGTVAQWVQNHEVMIPFYGPNGAFRRISALDILRENVPRNQLAGKIVFMGLTTTGLGDVVPTPVSALDQPVPGVEIHATVFSALRDRSLITYASNLTNVLVALLLLPALLFLYSRALPKWSLLSAVVAALLPIVLSFLMYRYGRLWYPPLAASIPLLVSYLLWSWNRLEYINFFLERERNKLIPFVPQHDQQDNNLLAEFFRSAQLHLPIEGWRFSSDGQLFSGGTGLPDRRVIGTEGRWRVSRGVHARQYPGKHKLHIEIAISEPAYGKPIANYVNNLARVQTRAQSSTLSGSIEKLQTNALKLGEQLAWMRSVKIVTDNILAGSPVGFGVWNAAGECIRDNQLLYDMVSGFRERGGFRDFLLCTVGQVGDEEMQSDFHQLILESQPRQLSCTFDDRELVVNFSAVGETLAERLVCASVLDVTDIRTAERARAEMVDFLSHDLRSPLISALYLLENESDSRIAENIQHSLAMMDDLLHVARADSLNEVTFQPVLMNAVLDNSLDQMLPQALNNDIRLEVETVDDDLWIEGDAASLERAISNILSNAIKYSPQGTRVRVHLFREGPNAILTIDDQGIGIDPAMLGQLFTRFRRDSRIAGQFKGIGLGLALVARVVSLHGGKVAASNTDEGARITLELPLEVDDSSVLPQEAPKLIASR